MVGSVSGYSNMDALRYRAMQQAQAYAQQNGQVQQNYASQNGGTDTISFGQNPQVQNQAANQPTEEELEARNCTDGKDDGHIGFWNATGHFLKGAVWNFAKGLLGFEKDGSWSFGKLAGNIVMGGLVLATGPIGMAVAAGIGLASTAIGGYQAIKRAANAKTDAECKDAFEDIGTNATGFALSFTGAKTAMSKLFPNINYNGIMGAGRLVRDMTWKPVQAGWKTACNAFAKDGAVRTFFTAKGVPARAWNSVSDGLTNLKTAYQDEGWTGVKDAIAESSKKKYDSGKSYISKKWQSVKNAFTKKEENSATTIKETKDAKIKEITDKVAKLEKQIESAKDAGTQAKLQTRIDVLKAKQTQIENAYADMESVSEFNTASTKIKGVKDKIADLQKQLKEATDETVKTNLNKQIAAEKVKLGVYEDVTKTQIAEVKTARSELAEIIKQERAGKATPEMISKKAELQATIDGYKTPKSELRNAQKVLNKAKKAQSDYTGRSTVKKARLEQDVKNAQALFDSANKLQKEYNSLGSNNVFKAYYQNAKTKWEGDATGDAVGNTAVWTPNKVPFSKLTIPSLKTHAVWANPVSMYALEQSAQLHIENMVRQIQEEQMKLVAQEAAKYGMTPEQFIAAVQQEQQQQQAGTQAATQPQTAAAPAQRNLLADMNSLDMAMKYYGVH